MTCIPLVDGGLKLGAAALPLAAVDIGDIVRILVLFLFIVVPIIGQILSKIKQIPPPDKRPIPPRPALPDVTDEIEEFLRRSGQAEKKAARPKPAAPVKAEVVQAEAVGSHPVGGQVGRHVAQRLGEGEFARHGESLGKGIAQINTQVGQHLQQVFDHKVSQFDKDKGPAPQAAPPAPDAVTDHDAPPIAADLISLLRNPATLRQAILLNEILSRPEERWG